MAHQSANENSTVLEPPGLSDEIILFRFFFVLPAAFLMRLVLKPISLLFSYSLEPWVSIIVGLIGVYLSVRVAAAIAPCGKFTTAVVVSALIVGSYLLHLKDYPSYYPEAHWQMVRASLVGALIIVSLACWQTYRRR
ncbi:MAG: hypothetical protein K2X27_10060 [Candidatus Obscuribacterales bacterium]|nr:hypothetical protein [Candidatus Obscuribacterales bacterium]